jgi:putative transposase
MMIKSGPKGFKNLWGLNKIDYNHKKGIYIFTLLGIIMVKRTLLIPGKYYHIFNRGINRENIFFEERNYHHFLKLYAKYITPIADTFAYCLLRNHFHLLIRIKEPDPKGFQNPLGFKAPSQAFSNLFNAYAKAINRAYQRTGSLFEHPFKRAHITSNTHSLQLVAYIHQNPQKHGFVEDFMEWPYSSYSILTSTKPTNLPREDVHAWFTG